MAAFTAEGKSAAQKRGLVTPGDADTLDELEALALVFHAGVSTSPMMTEISGRGLGLAIVREKVENLGGAVSVETAHDVGTTFHMVLPLTLTTLRGVLVRVAEHLFVVPTTDVERVLRINHADIKTVENRQTLQLDGRAIALVRLAEALELSSQHTTTTPVDGLYQCSSATHGGGGVTGIPALLCTRRILRDQKRARWTRKAK